MLCSSVHYWGAVSAQHWTLGNEANNQSQEMIKRCWGTGLLAICLFVPVVVFHSALSIFTCLSPTIICSRCLLASWSHRLSLLLPCTRGSWRKSKQRGNFDQCRLTRSAGEGWVRELSTSLPLLLLFFLPSLHTRIHTLLHRKPYFTDMYVFLSWSMEVMLASAGHRVQINCNQMRIFLAMF